MTQHLPNEIFIPKRGNFLTLYFQIYQESCIFIFYAFVYSSINAYFILWLLFLFLKCLRIRMKEMRIWIDFSSRSGSVFLLSLLCGSGSGSFLKRCISAMTTLETLQGSSCEPPQLPAFHFDASCSRIRNTVAWSFCSNSAFSCKKLFFLRRMKFFFFFMIKSRSLSEILSLLRFQ